MSASFYSTLVAFATVALVLTGCGNKSSSSGATNANATAESSPLTAPVDYLGALGKSKQIAVKTVDTASINQAIQLFKVDQGRYPTTLDELVQQKFMPRLPEPPYGMKFSYDAQNGVVKVVKQ